MHSVVKGNAFEDRVFDAITRELDAERLGFVPKLTKPFRKKGYYSRDRNSNIIVDISIEVWLPAASHWSLLWVCECKDYTSRAIPVDDMEEFKAKLDQIAGANKKGVIAISGALQAGALKYARANGIGVVRLLPDDQVCHILYSRRGGPVPSRDSDEFVKALTEPSFVGANRHFYAEGDGCRFDGWCPMLRQMLGGVPPLADSEQFAVGPVD